MCRTCGICILFTADILAADKQLAAEILFDLTKLENESKTRRESM